MIVRKLTHVGPALLTMHLHMFHPEQFENVTYICTALFFALIISDDLRRRNRSIHARYSELMYMKPREKTELGASVYYFGGVISNLYFGLFLPKWRVFCVIGILSLGIGDPVAWFCGHFCGITRIYKEKSLGGFAGCALVCFTLARYILSTSSTKFSNSDTILGIVAGMTAAIAEVAFQYDNFFIPTLTCASLVLFEISVRGL
eukprot:g384.t1